MHTSDMSENHCVKGGSELNQSQHVRFYLGLDQTLHFTCVEYNSIIFDFAATRRGRHVKRSHLMCRI